MPLVSIVGATTLSIVCAAGMAPDAVAKQIDPVITLSQVQGFRSPLILPARPVARPKSRAATAKRASAAGKRKGKNTSVDHFRLGLALKARGNSNKALIEFLKASQKNPRQINAFYEQALIFRKQGYLKLADSALEQAIRIANSTAKNPQKKFNPQFSADDLNRIRLLLITVRLEQGNVGSAAEELGRSLGIALTVPQKSASTHETGNVTNFDSSNESPTTILQSLHPKIQEAGDKAAENTKSTPQIEEKKSSTESAEKPGSEYEEKTARQSDGSSVSSLLKESLAGLKDHVFNPLSMLGLQRMSTDTAAAKESKKKEKRARRNKKEPIRKEPKIETASEESAKTSAEESKRKRRSWFDRKLALAPTSDVKPADMSSPPEETVQTQKSAEQNSAGEIAAQLQNIEKDSSDLVLTSKVAAVTFTPERSEPADESSTKEASWNSSNDATRFSLTVPAAVSQKISLVAALLSAFGNDKSSSQPADKKNEKPKDPVEERLKYLAEHGTSSLKEGEAFMFSEESGEATLFMSNGEVIRKTIAIARRHEEVAQLRRPDILIPEELIYNLALMAKILPKQDEPKETVIEPEEEAPKLKMPARISVPDSKAYSFSDWLRGVLNL
ncbi:MAG: hypothetical protein C0507_02835 [Cyanobacteria bacterium PR.3.49]|nr:hypothetical protein [Cyanobacteria bacterium PR.3.49]